MRERVTLKLDLRSKRRQLALRIQSATDQIRYWRWIDDSGRAEAEKLEAQARELLDRASRIRERIPQAPQAIESLKEARSKLEDELSGLSESSSSPSPSAHEKLLRDARKLGLDPSVIELLEKSVYDPSDKGSLVDVKA